MFQVRSRLATALGGAIVAAAMLAVPAAAQASTGDVWVAHGIPGAKVDVCVNGDAIRRDFRYGSRFRVTVPALTPLNVKVRAHGAGAPCTGDVLAREILSVEPGSNVTVLATLRAGQAVLVHWNNGSLLTACGAGGGGENASVTVHHQAKAGRMAFVITTQTIVPVGVVEGGIPGPIAVPVARYAAVGPIPLLAGPHIFSALPVFGDTPSLAPTIRLFEPFTDYQLILVGTNADNYRWIRYGNTYSDC